MTASIDIGINRRGIDAPRLGADRSGFLAAVRAAHRREYRRR